MSESVDPGALSDRAALVALAGLPGMSPRRFTSLLALAAPAEVWERVREARIPPSGHRRDPAPSWASRATSINPERELERHVAQGIDVVVAGAPGYPERLVDDPDRPPVLFVCGGPSPLDRPTVAIVGTRRCSRYGYEVARELGAGLAARGVDVVSGLAHGIDAAAHRGVLDVDVQRALGVVGSGLDVIYPRGNRELWGAVRDNGHMVSEWPLGTPSLPWRFPARNRLIAALSDAVVVVESQEKGGSMHTVDQALLRNRRVVAVPGSIRSTASSGTHRLIADGAEVLVAIGDFIDSVAATAPSASCCASHTANQLADPRESTGSWLLDWLGWEAATIDRIVADTSRPPLEVTLEVERQIAAGRIVRSGARLERIR